MKWSAVDKQVKAISKTRMTMSHSFLNKQYPTVKQFYNRLQTPVPDISFNIEKGVADLEKEKLSKTECLHILNKINHNHWKTGLFSSAGTPKGVLLMEKEIEKALVGKESWAPVLAKVKELASKRLEINYKLTKRDKVTEDFYHEVVHQTPKR